MIDLEIQKNLLIFSLIYGFLFSVILDFSYKLIHHSNQLFKILFSLLIIGLMTLVYFIGIKKIGEAFFHLYSIIAIIIGFFSYDILNNIIEKNKKK